MTSGSNSSNNGADERKLLSHNSLLRGVSINQTFPHRVSESVKSTIEGFVRKVTEIFHAWDTSQFVTEAENADF
jgi:hypothetical protein